MAEELDMKDKNVAGAVSGGNCSCGHDHGHAPEEHPASCCGHDHNHDHGHDHGETKGFCPCGHDTVTEGVGHDRAMGRIFFALLGGLLTVNSFLLQWLLPDQEYAASMSALFGAFILALPIIITAIKDLINGKVYMNELVALAILAALASADFQTAGIIAFFLLLTIIIETRTASGAQRSIEELIKLTPNTARRLDGDQEVEVQVTDLAIGDRIRVRPGENFPVDARIISGESTVNQASITGESLPVEKYVGSDVFAGTQNLTGLVDLEVTKVGEDTTLGKVKDMILQAESSRTPVVRIIDRYAGYYTPTVYKTWRNYIQDCSVGTTQDDWHFSQEDVLGGLMWGTQVMQRLAGEVRVAENAIVRAEKMAAYARLYKGMEC